MKRGLSTRLAATGAVAALALGVAACEVEDGEGVDNTVDDTTQELEDTGEDLGE